MFEFKRWSRARCKAALQGSAYANATVGTIRWKLLKIGSRVRASVRRLRVAIASGCRYQHELRLSRDRGTE
jgi:hypothetical protein